MDGVLPPRKLRHKRIRSGKDKDEGFVDQDPIVFHHYVVIGGGIAGVSCCQELARLNPDNNILLISSSAVLKVVCEFY